VPELRPADRARPGRQGPARRPGHHRRGWTGTVYKPQGCEACRFTGTKGRVGVYEVLVVTPKLRDAIERGATHAEMQSLLTHDDFIPMARYARFLLENKMVSVDELRRLFPVR
jgi:type II secretory ATPase GspE/PulE/Tfp pilus assembly ATPase PilB-like protein